MDSENMNQKESFLKHCVESLQSIYESIDIQRACILCDFGSDSGYECDWTTEFYASLEQLDFPVQFCCNIPYTEWDPLKRLYILDHHAIQTQLQHVMNKDDVTVVFICYKDPQKRLQVLSEVYKQSRDSCQRSLFFISL